MALAFPVRVDEAAALKYLSEHVSADLAHLLQDAGVLNEGAGSVHAEE